MEASKANDANKESEPTRMNNGTTTQRKSDREAPLQPSNLWARAAMSIITAAIS